MKNVYTNTLNIGKLELALRVLAYFPNYVGKRSSPVYKTFVDVRNKEGDKVTTCQKAWEDGNLKKILSLNKGAIIDLPIIPGSIIYRAQGIFMLQPNILTRRTYMLFKVTSFLHML